MLGPQTRPASPAAEARAPRPPGTGTRGQRFYDDDHVMMVIMVMFSIRNLTAAQAADLHAALSSLPKSFSSQMSQYAAAAQLSGKTENILEYFFPETRFLDIFIPS